MTVNYLKKMLDDLIREGHGDEELKMDTDPDVDFDIEFIDGRTDDFDYPYIGVRTNDNH